MNFLNNFCYNYLETGLCDLQLDIVGKFTVGFAAMPLINIIHEAGHAGAAYLLYENCKPRIKLISYGYLGGSCFIIPSPLSKVGTWLGESNALTIILAAGPVVQMGASLALSRFFPGNGVSATGLAMNAFYAINALSQKAFFSMKVEDSFVNDFVGVKIHKGGLAAGTLIVTSVALGIFGLYLLMVESMVVAAGRMR